MFDNLGTTKIVIDDIDDITGTYTLKRFVMVGNRTAHMDILQSFSETLGQLGVDVVQFLVMVLAFGFHDMIANDQDPVLVKGPVQLKQHVLQVD